MGDNIAIWGTAGIIAVPVLIAGMKCERRSGSEMRTGYPVSACEGTRPMTDAPALKPCPFCRGIARIGGEALYVSARCSKCSATVGWVLKPGEEADAVISAWNTRADLIDMDVLRRVEKILVYHLSAQGAETENTFRAVSSTSASRKTVSPTFAP